MEATGVDKLAVAVAYSEVDMVAYMDVDMVADMMDWWVWHIFNWNLDGPVAVKERSQKNSENLDM